MSGTPALTAHPPRLYGDLAWLWPHLSPPEHYAAEADTLRQVLDAHFGARAGGAPRLSLMELGAGGGHTLYHLRDDFDCVAVDLSDTMLLNCRDLNPGMPTHVGDMRTLRLDQRFDAVLIHDAVDYMTTQADARAAVHTATAHLKPGGLVLIAPTYTRETFIDGDVAHDSTEETSGGLPVVSGRVEGTPRGARETSGGGVTYFSYVHDPDPADDQMEMILIYLMRDPGTRRVELVEDRHACGLFGSAQWLELMRDAGLTARAYEEEEDEAAWSLFVGWG